MKKTIAIIIEVLVVLLVIWFVLGYLNFGRITKSKEPIFVVKENFYTTEDGAVVEVYDNIIYKVVKYEKENIVYSLKLWFMKDY